MRIKSPIKTILGLSGFIIIITACVAVGYYLMTLFNLSGLWLTLFSLWTGILLLVLLVLIMHFISKHLQHENNDIRQHSILLEAMARIAQGDFSVFIKSGDRAHTELADAINNMAKNLGNLEIMRQDFISNVSHEIQSPLTSISGFAALLKQNNLPINERERYLNIIESESKRLSSLSKNLLKLSSLNNDPITKSDMRLDKQISTIILTLEPQWSAKNLIVEADLNKCVVYGDEDLLSEVWMNLFVNAIKFTPEGGTILVSINENTVKITDTGIGILKDDLPHIFERFFKVDKARDRALGGNGLGLSLVKKIVELHGGQISVESKIGSGTTFEIYLPTAKIS